MISAMHIVTVGGLVLLAVVKFRGIGGAGFLLRLPSFILLSFFWVVVVMFGGLLVAAFAETASG